MKKHVNSVNLESFRRRYKRSGRKGKGKLLTELSNSS